MPEHEQFKSSVSWLRPVDSTRRLADITEHLSNPCPSCSEMLSDFGRMVPSHGRVRYIRASRAWCTEMDADFSERKGS